MYIKLILKKKRNPDLARIIAVIKVFLVLVEKKSFFIQKRLIFLPSSFFYHKLSFINLNIDA